MEVQAQTINSTPRRELCNKSKLIGQKPPLRPKHVWSIRTRLQMEGRTRDLAMFNLAIDSKLRGCDVVALRVEDVAPSGYMVDRATVRQKKTGRPVRFELTEQTRQAVDDYIKAAGKKPGEFLFSGRGDHGGCLTTRQYARLVSGWVATIGLDPHFFGTHSLRRTKATLIYRRTGNLRAVQLLLSHTKIESTVRYLGIEVDDALVDWIADGMIDAISGDTCRSSRSSLSAPAGPIDGHGFGFAESTDLDHRLRAAEAVVREAGRLAADHFARRELLSIDRKGAQDLVARRIVRAKTSSALAYLGCSRGTAFSARSAQRWCVSGRD